MDTVPLSGVFDKNGNPLQNVFMDIPDSDKKQLEKKEVQPLETAKNLEVTKEVNMSNNLETETKASPSPENEDTSSSEDLKSSNNNLDLSNLKKKIEEIKALPADNPKRKLFLDAIGGALSTPGAAVGVGALGAGMAARTGRKEQFYFDKTKIELDMNLQNFRSDYLEYEYTALRDCNLYVSRIDGRLESLQNNLVYHINNRVLEMIDLS